MKECQPDCWYSLNVIEISFPHINSASVWRNCQKKNLPEILLFLAVLFYTFTSIYTDTFRGIVGQGKLIVRNGSQSGDSRIANSISSGSASVNGQIPV